MANYGLPEDLFIYFRTSFYRHKFARMSYSKKGIFDEVRNTPVEMSF